MIANTFFREDDKTLLLRHGIYWMIIYIMYSYMMSEYGMYQEVLLVNLVNVPLFMLAFYLLRYVQIPLFFNTGKTLFFIISLLISALFFSMACRLSGYLWVDELFGREVENYHFTIGSYLKNTVRFYTPGIILLALELNHERQLSLKKLHHIESQKLSTELKFLKAQINPHFLFNTLNNLYSFVVTESPEASGMLQKIRATLDFLLYKSQKKYVRLNEEIGAINNFIELEKIRYGDRLKVSFKAFGNQSIQISPLILLSLVENAFKHGASGDIDNPKIEIKLDTSKNLIKCQVWNTKSGYKGELNDDYKEGIGLSNIRRQLNLTYPKSHELLIEDEENSFNVILEIKIDYE